LYLELVEGFHQYYIIDPENPRIWVILEFKKNSKNIKI
jgi:hypothetical protein